MKRILTDLRQLQHLLLLSWALFQSRALEEDECATGKCGHSHSVGGQAVLEGVMMRGRRSWGIAVRRPSQAIGLHSFLLNDLGKRYPLLKLPVLRGIVALGESLSLGVRALGISANLSTGEEIYGEACVPVEDETKLTKKEIRQKKREQQTLGWKDMGLSLVIAVFFSIGLFVALPLFIAKELEFMLENAFLFNLVEGVIRVVIFLAYVVVISRIPDLRRVFQYHGAEHKTIHAFEAGEQLVPQRINKKYSTLHPRCGTAFLLIVMVLAILVFAVVGKPGLWILVASRIIGIPLVAGLSYEVIKYAGRHKDGFLATVVLWPGLGLQRLTTREPTDDQVEVAVSSLSEVLRVDGGQEPLPCRMHEAGRVPAPAGA